MATKRPTPGTIVWHDLTVANADAVRDFYREVVGWTPEAVDMGGYSDWSMATPSGETVAGVCHARGVNAKVPPQWLVYVQVADLDAAMERCVALGGRIVDGPRSMGKQRFVWIQDPAGAFMALTAK